LNLLLDTNAFLWLLADDPRIHSIREVLKQPDTQVFISAVSWWEMAIKIRIGKLQADLLKMRQYAEDHDFFELPITSAYISSYLELPEKHKDPFDHMLLAQAITEPMRLVTGDVFLAEYSPLVMTI
jgi:PIN domain nuclease of toxin-antitoxin system